MKGENSYGREGAKMPDRMICPAERGRNTRGYLESEKVMLTSAVTLMLDA